MKILSQQLDFVGPSGRLQAILDQPENDHASLISVNCHPHSLHGGSMTNKVIHTVARTMAGMGIPSLRFNFRGVDQSQGSFDQGIGEQEDCLAAIEWMQHNFPDRKLILSGFSFGAYVSTLLTVNQLSAANQPLHLLSVAPPVNRFDYGDLKRPACEWSIIMGTEDELVSFTSVEQWVEKFSPQPSLYVMTGASHFFHGRLLELRTQIEQIVSNIAIQ